MRLVICSLLALAFAGPLPEVRAQTIMGQVVSLTTRKPLPAVRVALVDDSARVVAVATTDSALGAFYADAPHPGRYRVVLYAPHGGSFVSPAVVVDSGAVSERTYSVPEIPAAFQGEFWPGDVTRPARIASTRGGPRYPTTMREGGVRGSVSVAFVVDSTGDALVDSMQVVVSTNDAFTQSVRQVLRGMTFAAAELDGRKVRQVMQLTFGFGFSGDQVYGDVVTMASGVSRRIP